MVNGANVFTVCQQMCFLAPTQKTSTRFHQARDVVQFVISISSLHTSKFTDNATAGFIFKHTVAN